MDSLPIMAEEPRRGPPVVEIVLPSYITTPGEDEKFYPSQVKAIAEKVRRYGRCCGSVRAPLLDF